MKKENIKVNGHIGTWYVIDTCYHMGKKVFELEHEEFGGDAPHIIIDENKNIILEDVWNGWLDLAEYEQNLLYELMEG